jgi:hypothetical protein
MNVAPIPEENGIRLPATLAIGFTGHRALPNEAECRKHMLNLLAQEKAAFPGTIYGVCSVAAGGDLLFAESCTALGIPFRVLLPLPIEDFRADFDESSWSRAQQAMHNAISVDVIGSAEPRNERYYECGLETVQQSQLLFAIWNGQPASGLGGTQEIVAFATRMGRPVVWIHSETTEIQTLNQQHRDKIGHDPELAFLNDLPLAGAAPAGGSAKDVAEAWLAKLDANAVQVAPQVRKLAAFPIICTALAAFLSAAGPRMPSMSLWLGAGAVLGLMAGLLPAVLRLGKRQTLWVRIRTAAEISRSVAALWDAPTRFQIVGPEILPELSGMLESLNLMKSQSARTDAVTIVEFKAQYLKSRLLDQTHYFSRQSKKSAEQAGRYRLISKVATVSAIVISAWTFGRSLFKPDHLNFGRIWLPLLASALFQVATVAGALVVVHDCDRRQRRYDEIRRSLVRWEIELEAFHTWHPVIQVVNNIERALLVELLEWRALLQNRKMPRS